MQELEELLRVLDTLRVRLGALRDESAPLGRNRRTHQPTIERSYETCKQAREAISSAIAALEAAKPFIPAAWVGDDAENCRYLQLLKALKRMLSWLKDPKGLATRGFSMPMYPYDPAEEVEDWKRAEGTFRELWQELRDYIEHASLRSFALTPDPAPAELAPTAPPATAPPVTPGDDLFSAEDYRLKHGLPPDRLDKARRDGRLSGEKRHGRWYYSKAEVSKLWPDAFTSD